MKRDARSNSQPHNFYRPPNASNSPPSQSVATQPQPQTQRPTMPMALSGSATPQMRPHGFHPQTHHPQVLHPLPPHNPHHPHHHSHHGHSHSHSGHTFVHHGTYLSPSFLPVPVNHAAPVVPPFNLSGTQPSLKRSPVTPQRSPQQPTPRLSMLPPAVNYSDSYTFPPQQPQSSSQVRTMSKSTSSSPSSASDGSGHSDGNSADGKESLQRANSVPHTVAPPSQSPVITSILPSQSQAQPSSLVLTSINTQAQSQVDRLESLRPESLSIPRSSGSTTSPLSNLSHSISLPTLPAPISQSASGSHHHHSTPSMASVGHSQSGSLSNLFMSYGHESMEYRDLDASIGILQLILHQNDANALTSEKLQRDLKLVIDQLITVKSSSLLRSSNIHSALFQTLALRRSTSETMADQEVVDWLGSEYLTPRRGSTSSDGNSNSTIAISSQPASLAHSVSHSSALGFVLHPMPSTLPHSQSSMEEMTLHHHLNANSASGHNQLFASRRLQSVRSNSVSSGVTMRSGSHPSLDARHYSNINQSLPLKQSRRASTSTINAPLRRHSHNEASLSKLFQASSFVRIVKRLSAIGKRGRPRSMSLSVPSQPLEEIAEEKINPTISDCNTFSRDNDCEPTLFSPPALNKIDEATKVGVIGGTRLLSPSSSSPLSGDGVVKHQNLSVSVSQASPPAHSPSQSLSASQVNSASKSKGRSRSQQSVSQSPSLSFSQSQTSRRSQSESSQSSLTPTSAPQYFALLDRLLSDPIHTLLATVNDWSFDLFAFHSLCGNRTLSVLACHLFSELDLFEKFNVSREVFAAFITALEDGYNDVPYHNAIHACDVMLNMHFLMQTPTFAASITALDVFASLIAAAAHDFQHPGTNNAYQIATHSDLAIRYNDSCVLENMHCAEAFFLLKKPDHNIFESFPAHLWAEARSIIIHEILATDMQQHFKNLAELKAEIESKRAKHESFDHTSSTDRLILLANGLHCADLGNPCKPLSIYLEWTKRLMEEFYLQGDSERALGLNVSLMMDRSKPNVERSQIGFMDVICQPLWETLNEITPELAIAIQHLSNNREHWAKMMPPSTAAASAADSKDKSTTSSPREISGGSTVSVIEFVTVSNEIVEVDTKMQVMS